MCPTRDTLPDPALCLCCYAQRGLWRPQDGDPVAPAKPRRTRAKPAAVAA